MKNMMLFFISLLFVDGMFGVETDEVKMSVTEGETVTLKVNVTLENEISWSFESQSPSIAEIKDKKIKYGNQEMFKGRLNVNDQTGDLTIRNIKIKHSGIYKAEIYTSEATIYKRFSVTVQNSPSGIDPDRSDVEVMEGKSVTLNTDIINPHGHELIVWRFGHILIAKVDKENNKISLYPDERFRERIHLDQTGSLIITDIRASDTGEYKLKISSSNRDTKHKRFILYVNQPPLSAGAIIGITVAVLIVAAAAAVGVIYYRRSTSELEKLKEEQERLKQEQERLKATFVNDAAVEVNESAGLLNNAADDGVNEEQGPGLV